MSKETRLDLYEWYDASTDMVKCLECNKWMKSVTAHLRVHHMNGEEYRERWGIFKTTPLMSKQLIEIAVERMNDMRESGKMVVSPKGVAPKQLQGRATGFKRSEYKEFDAAREATRRTHTGKVVSDESKRKNSEAHKGKPTWNKTEPVTRHCERDGVAFTCMRWQPNKYCSKRCAMLSNQNWLERKSLKAARLSGERKTSKGAS